MRRAYMDDWVHGQRRPMRYYRERELHRTAGFSVEQRIADTVVNPPQKKDTRFQMAYLYMDEVCLLYSIPSGDAITMKTPFLSWDLEQAMVWLVNVDNEAKYVLHVTKNETRTYIYEKWGHNIAERFGAIFIGTVSYTNYLEKCVFYSFDLMSVVSPPQDDYIFHTIDGARALTPDQMIDLPAIYWVKMSGKNDHKPRLIVSSDHPELNKDWNEFLRDAGMKGLPVWTIEKARNYYRNHKDEEKGLVKKVGGFISRHKKAIGLAGALLTLYVTGTAIAGGSAPAVVLGSLDTLKNWAGKTKNFIFDKVGSFIASKAADTAAQAVSDMLPQQKITDVVEDIPTQTPLQKITEVAEDVPPDSSAPKQEPVTTPTSSETTSPEESSMNQETTATNS